MSGDAAFASETDLCTAFVAALPAGWTAYPETSDWDILLVRADDGFQIGVEAKLRLNVEVVNQALDETYWRTSGPDCRAVLVPEDATGKLGAICAWIGITIIRMRRLSEKDRRWNAPFRPDLPTVEERYRYGSEKWHELCPAERLRLPEYVPDVAAGAPAPLRLTDWKIKAIKLAVVLDRRGYVTREDFKTLELDHRRWLARENEWLRPSEGGFVRGGHMPDFRAQHPKVYAQIEAAADDWMPPAAARQLALGQR